MKRTPLIASFAASLVPAFLLAACLQLPPTVDDDLQPQPGDELIDDATGTTLGQNENDADDEKLDFADAVESSDAAQDALTGSGALAERAADSGILEIGNPKASILLVFTNFSCDYCKDFAQNFLPQIEKDFIAKGLLRVQLIVVPLKKYPQSALQRAALVCATQQGKGRVMHDQLFNINPRTRVTIVNIAKDNELEMNAFQSCLDDDQTKLFQSEQEEIIRGLTVSLIPSFFLYEAHPDEDPAFSLGESITGLPTYPDLRGMIEKSMQ